MYVGLERTAKRMRLIDADALMAEMHNVILEDGEDRRIFYEVIERQPTIDPVKWIPVSERLPDVMGFDERYLVSLAWGGVGVMEYKSTGFHNYGSFNPVPIETVTAWMPLPEPWRGEEDE